VSPALAVSADGWSVAVLAKGEALPVVADACWSPVVFPHSDLVPDGRELVYRVEVSAHDPDAQTCRDLTFTVISDGESVAIDGEPLLVGRVGRLRVLTLPRDLADGQPHVLSLRIPGGAGVVGVQDCPSFRLRQRLGLSWWLPDRGAGLPLSVRVNRGSEGDSLVVRACLENRYQVAREGVLVYELLDADGAVIKGSPDFPVALDERERCLREDVWEVSDLPDWWPHRPINLFLRAVVRGHDGGCDERSCPVPLAQYKFSGGEH